MIHFFAISLGITALVAVWRKQHHRKVQERFEHKMFALRDELRWKAGLGEIDAQSNGFKYLDYTISKTINEAYFLTLFRIMAISFQVTSSENYEKKKEVIQKEIRDVPQLNEILTKHQALLLRYVAQQHYVTWKFIRPVLSLILGIKTFRKKMNSYMNDLLISPSTSAADHMNNLVT